MKPMPSLAFNPQQHPCLQCKAFAADFFDANSHSGQGAVSQNLNLEILRHIAIFTEKTCFICFISLEWRYVPHCNYIVSYSDYTCDKVFLNYTWCCNWLNDWATLSVCRIRVVSISKGKNSETTSTDLRRIFASLVVSKSVRRRRSRGGKGKDMAFAAFFAHLTKSRHDLLWPDSELDPIVNGWTDDFQCSWLWSPPALCCDSASHPYGTVHTERYEKMRWRSWTQLHL